VVLSGPHTTIPRVPAAPTTTTMIAKKRSVWIPEPRAGWTPVRVEATTWLGASIHDGVWLGGRLAVSCGGGDEKTGPFIGVGVGETCAWFGMSPGLDGPALGAMMPCINSAMGEA
jgi:hypothetical protein